MKWIDKEKGILDYILSAVPLLTLIFLVSAYFHTVHPRFTKEEKLKVASQEIAELKQKIIHIKTKNINLSNIANSLKKELTKNNAKTIFLEKKYLSVASTLEKEDYLRNKNYLYFSKQDAIDSFKKHTQDLTSESGEKSDPTTVKVINVNITNESIPDFYVVDAWSCGSGGCMGPLFIQNEGAYCFSAWAHSKQSNHLKNIII